MSKEALWDSASDSEADPEPVQEPVLDQHGEVPRERSSSASVQQEPTGSGQRHSAPRHPSQCPQALGASARVHPALRLLLTPLRLTRANTLEALVEQTSGRWFSHGHSLRHEQRREHVHVQTQCSFLSPLEDLPFYGAYEDSDQKHNEEEQNESDLSVTQFRLRLNESGNIQMGHALSDRAVSGSSVTNKGSCQTIETLQRQAQRSIASGSLKRPPQAPPRATSSRSHPPVSDAESPREIERAALWEHEWQTSNTTLLEPCRCGRQCIEHLLPPGMLSFIVLYLICLHSPRRSRGLF